MAAAVLRNNQGQALVESLFIIPIFMVFLIYLIQVMLYLSVELAVDDALENYLLCELQKNQPCLQRLNKNIDYLPLKKVNLQFRPGQIEIKATALRIFHIKKIRQLNYVTEI